MRVWLEGYSDGIQREREDLSRLTPAEALEAVNDEAARNGLILSGIRVDGVEMDGDAFRALGGGHEAVFSLTSLQRLLRESLDSARDYSRKLRDGLELVAGQFEAGETEPALSNLSLALDGLNWLIGVYDRCRFFMAVPIRPNEEAAVQEALVDALKRLVALAGEGNFADVARALRGDVLPRVETLTLRVEDLSKMRTEPQ